MNDSNKLGVMPIPKLLKTMALPLVISMLIQALYNIVDSIFVSKISESALTSVSLAFPAQNLLIAFGVGLGLGINAVLSRYLGEGNRDMADDTANHAVFLWVAVSALFALIGFTSAEAFFRMQTGDPEILEMGITYFKICVGLSFGLFGQFVFERLLQAVGKAFYAMVTQIFGAAVNLILDPILIFKFDMGVKGAAWATVIGQISSCILAIFINLIKNKEVKFKLKGFKIRLCTLKAIFKIAFPAIVMQSLTSIMNFFMNLILIGFSGTATAVFNIYYKLQSFFFMPLYGTTNGLVPIVAYNLGARRKDRMTEAIRLAGKVALTLMVTGTFVFCAFPKLLLSMFDADSHMMGIGISALRIISLNFPFAGPAVVCSSVFQSTGNGFASLFCSLVRQIFILLPCAYLFSLTESLNLIWLSFPIAEFIGFVISVVLIKRLFARLDF